MTAPDWRAVADSYDAGAAGYDEVWPPALVRCAMAFAKAFRGDIEQQRLAEVGA